MKPITGFAAFVMPLTGAYVTSRIELMTVMTPTNRSPPNCASIVLQTICTALVVKLMMKPAAPSETISHTSFACRRMCLKSSL